MSTTATDRTIEQVEIEPPKLLVEWSSPWAEFRTSVGPALSRSGRPLAGEARTGLFPYRGLLASWGVEILLLLAIIFLPKQISRIRPVPPPVQPKWDVIYYSGDELPRTEDAGGARAGRSGTGGGAEAHHRTQTIRVAREERPREKIVDAPKMDLPVSNSAVANMLAYKGIPGPAPVTGLMSSSRAPSLETPAIAPPPQMSASASRNTPNLQADIVPPPVSVSGASLNKPKLTLPADVVAPPPAQVQQALTSRGSRPSLPSVIPPPVSAPEKELGRNPKLALPPPVAPPTDIQSDLGGRRGPSPVDLHRTIVPPPVSADAVHSNGRTIGGYGNTLVVAPPVSLNDVKATQRREPSYGGPGVVAPPVSVVGAPTQQRTMASLGSASVVPPPVTMNSAPGAKRVSGLTGDPMVVPPAPSVALNGRTSSSGQGNHPGLSGLENVAPPPAAKEPAGSGIIVSSQPGSKLAAPPNGGPGSLALSPNGGNKPGVGGGGEGAGIAHGSGPGSGLADTGPGVAKDGTGHGADVVARAGNSSYPGTGGSGSATTNAPAMPGVSVRGGSNNIITLPSFGGATNQDPSTLGRSAKAKAAQGPAVTIIATSRSGGAFNYYGALKGDKVYTIYIDTTLGTAVMQFADPASANHPYSEDLTAPQPLRADLPTGMKQTRLVIACVMDKAGTLRSTQVLEAGDAVMTAKVLAALPKWKFSPAMRGDQPVEVNAILGFAIDTR